MKTENLYSVASLVREDSNLGIMLERMREKLRKNKISFDEPKLGDHISWLSPFFATEDFAEGFAKGLRFCKLFENGVSVATVRTKECRYLDIDKRACVVVLEPGEVMRNVVEDLRVSISAERWKYLPDRFTLLMHATAAVTPKEQPSFYEKIMELPPKERPDDEVSPISLHIPTIFLNRKDPNTGKWSPVHF